MRNKKGNIFAYAGVILAVIAVIVVSVLVAGSTPYIEDETDFGTLKTEIILEFEDGTTEPLQFVNNPLSSQILTVYHYDKAVTGFWYKLCAEATDTSGQYDGILIDKREYYVDMVAKDESESTSYNTWSMIPSEFNDEYWNHNTPYGYEPGTIWIPVDGVNYEVTNIHVDINNPMPSSLSPMVYHLILIPKGELSVQGHTSTGWDDMTSPGNMPSAIWIWLKVESGGGLTVTFGQGWAYDD